MLQSFHACAVVETFEMIKTVYEKKREARAKCCPVFARLALRFADIQKYFPLEFPERE